MPKANKNKYDWPSLKISFLASDYTEVKKFFEDKYQAYNACIQKNTAGWTKEKQERDQRIAERVIAQMEEEEVTEMRSALHNIRKFFRGISDPEKLRKVKDAEIVWKVLRTENNLPTRYVHQTNVNKNVEDTEEDFNHLVQNARENQNQTPEEIQNP